ncbi:hypothetical protein ACFQ1M_07485 [Sungkyunkwania multivorans]|uniref:DNA primase n=1 Tax=Sungkyunkwania multivorans TaxID=1173618 RepID=A0ABW3CWY9_9FLAO
MKKKIDQNKKRVIIDFKKLNKELLDLLVEKFPEGYDDDDIITFRNASNEILECVEVETDTTRYLVKVSKRLVQVMEDHDDDNDDDDDNIDDGEDNFNNEEIDDEANEEENFD